MKDRGEQEVYLNSYIFPTLMDGLYKVSQQRPRDPVVELAKWLLRNNPNKPKYSECDVALVNDIKWMKQMLCAIAAHDDGREGGAGDGDDFADDMCSTPSGGTYQKRTTLSVIMEAEEDNEDNVAAATMYRSV